MTTKDEQFLQQLRATFEVEAREHLQALSSMLLELEKSPASAHQNAVIEDLHRRAHSLKGSSRAVDLTNVEAICQGLEDILSDWKAGIEAPSPEACDKLHHELNVIGELISSTSPARLGGAGRIELPEQMQTVPGAPSGMPSSDAAIKMPTLTNTVRISVSKLETQLLEAEGMLVLKSAAGRSVNELRAATSIFAQWRKEWAAVSDEVRSLRRKADRSRNGATGSEQFHVSPELLRFFDRNFEHIRSVEETLTSLVAQADQNQHELARTVNTLLEDSKRLLMLPFSTLADLFPKVIHDLCRDQHKEADLTLRGGEIEIDKRILEGIKDAIIHALRNCIDHGIESPEERALTGKPARAAINITARRTSSSTVEIVIADDGAGIDVERLKNAAVSRGFLTSADARSLSDTQSWALVFHSGVSTRQIITEISGRGLGMAIVRADTEKLGGRVAIESRPGHGTFLRITLPLTIATFRGLFVNACGRTFVLPTANIEYVVRIKPSDIQTVENRQTIIVDGQVVSVARLDAVLGLPQRSQKREDASAALSFVVLRSGDLRIAFVVDEVLHEDEVLVKPLRRPLVRVCNIAGATVTESGKALPVLDVADLFKSAQSVGVSPCSEKPVPSLEVETDMPMPKRLLVVEDSITSRMLLKGVLEAAGYQVKTAADGMDAFTALRTESFDLVVSDVEMPRLNGLGLTAKIRADKRLTDIPVILVTGLESPEQREHGIDAGADAYIVKSGFDQNQLLEAVRRLA